MSLYYFFLNAVDISLSILVEDLNTRDSSASQVGQFTGILGPKFTQTFGLHAKEGSDSPYNIPLCRLPKEEEETTKRRNKKYSSWA